MHYVQNSVLALRVCLGRIKDPLALKPLPVCATLFL
jgi:hypothetical protein